MRASRAKNYSQTYFGSIAHSYDGQDAYETVKGDYPDIVAELEREACDDVLDCGCGTGAVLELLHAAHPEKRLFGIDLAVPMVDVARQRLGDGAQLTSGDCEDLPYGDCSFDAVICSHSFHHYPHPQAFFDEVARVLRPGGRLILRDNTGPAWWLFKQNQFQRRLTNYSIRSGDVKFYNEREVRAMCSAAGLVVELFEERPVHKMHCVARKPLDAE